MTTPTLAGTLRQAAGVSIGLSVLMILLGAFAVAVPFATGIGVALLIGWTMVFGGFAHAAYAFAAESAGAFVWRLLIGILYVVGGFYLAFHPTLSLVSLTLVLAAVFFAEGVTRTIVFFQVRTLPGAGWILVDGILTVLLGLLLTRNWPQDSTWAIGTIVGINLVVSGFTRLMYSVAARKALAPAVD